MCVMAFDDAFYKQTAAKNIQNMVVWDDFHSIVQCLISS